jgi:hypothetical protein
MEQNGAAVRRSFGQDELSRCGDAKPVVYAAVLHDDFAIAVHQAVGRNARHRQGRYIFTPSHSRRSIDNRMIQIVRFALHKSILILIINIISRA